MAAGAAKYAHCQVHPPVGYRPRSPFRPEIAAPLDFPVRWSEVAAMDRELDRAVLGVGDVEALILESVLAHPGPGGLFLTDREGRLQELPPDRRGPSPTPGLGPRRRRFILNALRSSQETARFRPPWTESLVLDLHASLLTGLDLPYPPGEYRTAPHTAIGPRGQTLYETCPPERIPAELRGLLDWVDRYGATMRPIIPAALLIQGFQSIRPFPTGSTTVGRMLAMAYLQSFGLPNAGLAPIAESVGESPQLLQRLMMWSQATGVYTELIDFLMDRTMEAYARATRRWLGRRPPSEQLDEVALRLLSQARRSPGWFSASEAMGWVGGRGGPTVLRHLNGLVRRGVLESLGQTRAKRYRLVSPASVVPILIDKFGGPKYAPSAIRAVAREGAVADPASPERAHRRPA
ncbi:MAG: Fic family protein [Thermoplasmata archaeon]|nr:Fic family protein [Thermoplasmata archaeon]